MFFYIINFIHNEWVEISLQMLFVAKALEKRKTFFNPHPPTTFGSANLSHLTQAKDFWGPLQRREKQIFWILSKYP